MATTAELEAKISKLDWAGLQSLWKAIQAGDTPGWGEGEALEYLAIRAFELDPDESVMVRYPYEVWLFGEKVEEIDGAIHLNGLSCIVESKQWGKNIPIGPIVKMRSQLLRRPAATIGLVFSKMDFTTPAIYLSYFTMPQAVLLWSDYDIQIALDEGRICKFLRLKHRMCCEKGVPNYDLREEVIS